MTDNLATILENEIDRAIGKCPSMQPVDDALSQRAHWPLHLARTERKEKTIMTLQQLEERILKLEEKFQELEQRITPKSPTKPWRDTFGMFADDSEFDEVLRLGREYREQENQPAS